VIQAKNNKHKSIEKTTLQHTDFEALQRLIINALALGKLQNPKNPQ